MISSWKVGCVQERIDYRGVFLQGDRKKLAVPIRRRRIESNTPLQMVLGMPAGVPKLASGPVARLERLGGILSHYYREAA